MIDPWTDADTERDIAKVRALPVGSTVRLYHARFEEKWGKADDAPAALFLQEHEGVWKRTKESLVREDGRTRSRSTIEQHLGWAGWCLRPLDARRRLYTKATQELKAKALDLKLLSAAISRLEEKL